MNDYYKSLNIMPLIQRIDEKKFRQKPLYSSNHARYQAVGSGVKPLNHHPIFLQKQGGAFDLAGIINKVGNTMADNRDTISTVASSVANMSKSISDTVKASKELEKLRTIHEIQRKRSKDKQSKDVVLSPEQIASLEKLGNGFVKT
jgi:hypothetical protein